MSLWVWLVVGDGDSCNVVDACSDGDGCDNCCFCCCDGGDGNDNDCCCGGDSMFETILVVVMVVAEIRYLCIVEVIMVFILVMGLLTREAGHVSVV